MVIPLMIKMCHLSLDKSIHSISLKWIIANTAKKIGKHRLFFQNEYFVFLRLQTREPFPLIYDA